ncbi:hypothetical protein B0H11DRAFT_1929461 [Mycena galericulata]|nr:hypothetical protein B0H11DRAFT_1929461 [Mycena galericulata]
MTYPLTRSEAKRRQTQNYDTLLRVPVDVLLEIESHLPVVPVPAPATDQGQFLSSELYCRPCVVWRLAQTCRDLRATFHGRALIHVEAIASNVASVLSGASAREKSRANQAYIRQISLRLRAQLRLMKNLIALLPGYGNQVRCVSVALAVRSADRVYAEFANILRDLPNLHTLQISWAESPNKDALQRAFCQRDVSYTAVRHLAVSEGFTCLFPCFPHVTRLTYTGSTSSVHLREMLDTARSSELPIEYIHGQPGRAWPVGILDRLLTSFPDVKEIPVFEDITVVTEFTKKRNGS